MKAIEALEAMRQGLRVCIYYPDCEMYQLNGVNRVEITLVDFGSHLCETCSPDQFLSSFRAKEFVLYDPSNLRGLDI